MTLLTHPVLGETIGAAPLSVVSAVTRGLSWACDLLPRTSPSPIRIFVCCFLYVLFALVVYSSAAGFDRRYVNVGHEIESIVESVH